MPTSMRSTLLYCLEYNSLNLFYGHNREISKPLPSTLHYKSFCIFRRSFKNQFYKAWKYFNWFYFFVSECVTHLLITSFYSKSAIKIAECPLFFGSLVPVSWTPPTWNYDKSIHSLTKIFPLLKVAEKLKCFTSGVVNLSRRSWQQRSKHLQSTPKSG